MEWPSIDEVACPIIYIYIYEYFFRDDFLIMHWNNLKVSEKLILPYLETFHNCIFWIYLLNFVLMLKNCIEGLTNCKISWTFFG